ncbi:uncharacterized protein SCODWIG_00716 [Saccharomycodes ludwigii]|uniref:CID domain-containing protein n=1 Tax=Saccharomycodes ludwigii TaxID=36035 RepID=A0A376B2Q1_9ASCO|nr:hypothetical protein SCDLUD_004609 [Saccharomycodes ludwigii]KAH3899180.1 hypothetical protein SCDLUD_004609 [Saccharomycodes ludwigii]SSD58955.1 uncharacterized protein SCODWIG_00716 [Saccharomycodes ludwigii]
MSLRREDILHKLNVLNETQESIVKTSKWMIQQVINTSISSPNTPGLVSDTILEYLQNEKTNIRRKLLTIYLINDFAQYCKFKGSTKSQSLVQLMEILNKNIKSCFLQISDRLNSSQDIKAKVHRVVKIWKEREVFSSSVIMDLLKITEPSNFNKKVEGSAIIDNSTTSTIADASSNNEIPAELKFLVGLYNQLYIIKQKNTSGATTSNSGSVSIRSKIVEELKHLTELEKQEIEKEQKEENTGDGSDIVSSDNKNNSKYSNKDLGLIINSLNLINNNNISSNDITNANNSINHNSNQYTGELPTYEQQSDSDSDIDSDTGDAHVAKRCKLEQNGIVHTDDNKDLQEGITESTEQTQDIGVEEEENKSIFEEENVAEVNSNTVTSNLQDLLSKLSS